VDQYGSILLFLIIVIVVLSVVDSLLIMTILNDGGWEVNPLVRGAIQLLGHKFWVWKFAMASVPLIFLCFHSKIRRVMMALICLSAIHVAVVTYEIYLLAQG